MTSAKTIGWTERMVPVLMGLVVVMAFGMGAMWSKLQGLSSGDNGNLQAGTVPQPSTAPNEPTEISSEQFAAISNGDSLPILGESDAQVTIVEFSDLQCPFCKRFADQALVAIKKEYIDTGKARLIYRHYPLRSIHPDAYNAALAAECARDQNLFWQYHDEIFSNQTALSKNDLKKYAGNVGLGQAKFDKCLENEQFKTRIETDEKLAESVGVSGTPAFFVNGVMISGAMPFESFKSVIDGKL